MGDRKKYSLRRKVFDMTRVVIVVVIAFALWIFQPKPRAERF